MRFTVGEITTLTATIRREFDRLPAGLAAERRIFEDDGLGIRFRRGGGRYWIFQYRAGGKSKTATLGKLEKYPLARARAWAKEQDARTTLGDDPGQLKARAKAAAAITLKSLLPGYLAMKKDRLRPSSFRETKRYLETTWAPLHSRGVALITRGEISKRLQEAERESGAVAADRARAALSAFFSWAMQASDADIAANPVLATYRPAEPVSRDRVLTDAELTEIWQATGEDDFGRIVRLLILTGQRREEVAGMRWHELNLEEAVWLMPGERTKNHRAHIVPLSTAALGVVGDVPEREGRDLLFGTGESSFSGFSKAKAALDYRIFDARAKALGKRAKAMDQWVLHDIRRTVATRMADLGIGPHIVETVLNHISGHKAGVAGVYNMSAYAAEKREALNRWAEHVIGLASGMKAKVIPLRKAAS